MFGGVWSRSCAYHRRASGLYISATAFAKHCACSVSAGFPYRRHRQWQMHEGGFVNDLELTGFPGEVYSLFAPQYGGLVGIGDVKLQPSLSGEKVARLFQAPDSGFGNPVRGLGLPPSLTTIPLQSVVTLYGSSYQPGNKIVFPRFLICFSLGSPFWPGVDRSSRCRQGSLGPGSTVRVTSGRQGRSANWHFC